MGGELFVNNLVVALDLAGTFVFALSGAMAGARRRLDLFGMLVLSFAAATSGGIARDLLIGAVPPAAIGDWRFIVVSSLAGLVTFYAYQTTNRFRSLILVFDGAGLGLFAVSGTLKALSYSINPVAAVTLGILTGIGGGMVRDLLVAEVPTVLYSELYAVAAAAGAIVVVLGEAQHLPSVPVALAGAVLCFGLRMGAIRRNWGLPVARHADPPPDAAPGTGERTGSGMRRP